MRTDDRLGGHLGVAELEHRARREVLEVVDRRVMRCLSGTGTFSIPARDGAILRANTECPYYNGSTVVSLITVTVTDELIDCTFGSFDRWSR